MAKHKTTKNNGIIFIAIGVVVFFLRYVPFYNIWNNQYKSVDSLLTVCNSVFGMLANYCDWVKPLNIALIIIPILLIGYGIFILYKSNSK